MFSIQACREFYRKPDDRKNDRPLDLAKQFHPIFLSDTYMSADYLLLNLARRHPHLIILNVLLGFSGALFTGISTALIIPILLNFLGQPIALEGTSPIIHLLLFPFRGESEKYSMIGMTLVIIFLIGLKNLVGYCNALAAGALKRSAANDLREQSLLLLLEVDIEYYVKTGIGDIINRLNSEISRTASAIGIISRAVTVTITALVFIGLLLSLSWKLTIVSAGLLTIVALVNQYSIAWSKALGKQLSEASKNYTIRVLDLLTGMRLVRATANEQAEYQRVKQQIFNREQAEFRSQAASAMIEPVSEITGVLVLLCIVWVGRTFLTAQVESSASVLLTYLFVLCRTLPLIAHLNGARSQLANIIPSLDIIQDLLCRDNKSFMVNGLVPFRGLKQEIHFKQLVFAYPGQNQQVLKGVDLYLPRNTTLALVGMSGAGKSTLADLLPRFYDPTSGCILIDGRDLRDLDFRTLRRSMGIVSQDTFLFNATVRENIAYGCLEVTDEQIVAAARQANAYDFIMQLPQEFETQIGDRGILLSGGQRQRLAIARALIQDPEILILDEATSALDSVSERLVQEAIEHLSRNRTTLVIAHRLSTLKQADQIAVMDQGRIVELGTHAELIAKSGHYAHLWEMQFNEMPPAKNRGQQQQIAKTSHEVRSLLNGLVGSLSLIMNGGLDDLEEQREFTKDAYMAALSVLKSIECLEQSHESRQGGSWAEVVNSTSLVNV